jgi:5-methyltetrahydrofolate--homocysteine methyltransferase
MSEVFAEQINALEQAGVDGYVFETMMSIEEAVCGLKTAKKMSSLPVVVSMTYDKSDKGFATIMGVTPEKAVRELTTNKADIIGANCGMSADLMIELTKILKNLTSLPLWIKPNAGMPKNISGQTVYQETPETMAAAIRKIISAGASVVGGCCGTTPEHINAMVKIVHELTGGSL